ncbi:MAG: hypothetical protein QW683_07475 [Candidatus Caldarchaeum sp.]
MLEPDEHVKANISGFLPGFRRWLESDEAKSFLREREFREGEFRKLLDEKAIDQLSELEVRRIMGSLWAYRWWYNKEAAAEQVIENPGLDAFKSELKNLLYGDAPLAKRYDRFFEKVVKGVGPAGVTEILAFVNPSSYSIWNDKSRKALETLGLRGVLPTRKYKISGSEYEKLNEVLKSLFKLVYPNRADLNLLDVDLFLYYVATKTGGEVAVEEEEDYDFDHDEIVEKLVAIGNGLGFEAESEVQIAKGARVDVLWRAKIANLGVVSYVFEVQKGGSIDSLILNLQKAKKDPTVQKLVVVSNTKGLKKIRDEVESLAEEFRKSLAYMEAKDVIKASDLLSELSRIISRLELVKTP